ncbi:hypothetical protein [Arthrobacter sp. H14-L1]|uniref:hypothetical protein n=1 Tax=Arthrobacter sp. H14-L1 TaxID=2996697 RepID=UPI00226F12B0|nr:hypothetical protein [Arthrobacter sp. H14-L1]MCY0906210.1 hypothetical protein [Arthrobacter sp. H14-L1]
MTAALRDRPTSIAADTVVDLPLIATVTTGEVFCMRQISRIVPARGGSSRQIHILTTNSEMGIREVIYRTGVALAAGKLIP